MSLPKRIVIIPLVFVGLAALAAAALGLRPHDCSRFLASAPNWWKHAFAWSPALLVLPAVCVGYRVYRVYLERLAREKRHVEQMASLHLRTIEALALAIESKDHTTGDHLRRVQGYAIEIAREMGLPESEQEALRAAALLHDIGNLAVPEHILSKPGRLTSEEFEKMKTHPAIGAEILEQVQFPYPVAPIVRSHHEKWNGDGYPDGLKGEQIPIGARILAAVDCLDALATHRQYRRALPLDQAMQRVAVEAGSSFDPQVVDILQRRYVEWEKKAEAQARRAASTRQSGAATAPTRHPPNTPTGHRDDFLASIAAARQEAQTIFELSQALGNSLSTAETLLMLSQRLKELVPYDSIAVYQHKGDRLVPAYVSGENSRLFWSLEIPLGQGLSGWVAENREPILNGNPSVEPGYLSDPGKFSTLRAAVVVPLEGLSGVIGVLALYKAESNAFTRDHLRILLAISSKVGLTLENALRFERAESSATTDYLTGLPNVRSLFLHLDRELARCRRSGERLAVMVCDVDGFKQINDRFGHLAGNKVLRVFAEGLQSACREYDYVARLGGDEFVVIAPGLEPDAAAEKGSRLNDLVRQAGLQVCREDILTLSVGSAFYDQDGDDSEKLLAVADRRMYGVKQTRQQHPQADRTAHPEVQVTPFR